MQLARMAAVDEAALTCDFAETYQIYDWRALPATYAAILAAGLRESSRIKMRLSGSKLTAEQLLLAAIADHVRVLVWQNTKDGHSGENPPQSMLSLMLNPDVNDSESEVFTSPDEFNAWRQTMIGGVSDG